MLTPTARPHLPVCCITNPLRPETYLAGFLQGHVNAPQEAQMLGPSAFTQWFVFLTRQMPIRKKGVCHIARSLLISHGREQPTSR